MILKVLKPLIFLLGFIFATNAKSYENYKVYKVVPNSRLQLKVLVEMQKKGYDFWNDAFEIGTEVMVMVNPDQFEDFIMQIESHSIMASVRINDVQELIERQILPSKLDEEHTKFGHFSWNRYYTLNEINTWLESLQLYYPGKVRVVSMGVSTELREIKGVIIDFKKNKPRQVPLAGFMEGGIHAREWLSPAAVTWVIKEFLTSTDPDVRILAESFVWHIFPVVNPDGYVYSFSKDRLWKKNRSPYNSKACSNWNVDDDMSNGVDLNKNFNFRWTPAFSPTTEPCLSTYAGPRPQSEAESTALANYVNKLKLTHKLLYYFAFHAFGQMIIVPTGVNVTNYKDLYVSASRGAKRIHVSSGSKYKVTSQTDILYEIAGSSFDWAKNIQRIPIVYAFELRDRGHYGFLVPPSEIVSSNHEMMQGLIAIDRSVRDLKYYSASKSLLASVAFLLSSLMLLFVLK